MNRAERRAFQIALLFWVILFGSMAVPAARANGFNPLEDYPVEWCFAVTQSSDVLSVKQDGSAYAAFLEGIHVPTAKMFFAMIQDSLIAKTATQQTVEVAALECLAVMKELTTEEK
jgi:hypothetical protein